MSVIISEVEKLYNRVFKEKIVKNPDMKQGGSLLNQQSGEGSKADSSLTASPADLSDAERSEAPRICNTGGIEGGRHCIIDWVTFTLKEPFLHLLGNQNYSGDIKDSVGLISSALIWIFGFGVTANCHKGKFGYRETWSCGEDESRYALVMLGNDAMTLTVEVYGSGLQVAADGWEERLYFFLKTLDGKLNRVDIAKDFMNGEINPRMMVNVWKNGGFDTRGKRPLIEQVGKDWLNRTGTGCTLYIGNRKSSYRFTRIYEKGKQLGDKSSKWTRFEVEFKPQRRYPLPLELLVNADKYFVGSYPIVKDLLRNVEPLKVSDRKSVV